MPINIQDYLLGRIPVGRKIDIPSYLMAKAASGGGIQEVSGTLPLTVRSRASQILENYRFYGTASGAGVETENLWDGKETSLTNRQVTSTGSICSTFVITIPGTYTVKCFIDHIGTAYVYCKTYTISTDTYGPAKYLSLPEASAAQTVTVTETVDNDTVFLIYNPLSSDVTTTAELFIETQLCVVPGSTIPSSYIPHGYKLPITVTSNGTTTDYPIYIGDSQLGEEEYVDYEEQKIYKLVDGVLTPTDPPVPLPDITLPQATVTIDTEEEFKYTTSIKGKIEQI